MKYAELAPHASDVHERIQSVMKEAGALKIHEFPSGSMTPKDLNRLINKYKSMGLNFDLVVVDYADLMIPTHRMNDTIENSKRIYVDLRGIAQEHNLAMLTGTQTNREGMKAAVAKMTDVADDINKARTCDLLLSINASEDEVARNEARLYFAASRNQAGNRTIRIKQDLERGKFVAKVLGVD
jgi:replicative DNA helicase